MKFDLENTAKRMAKILKYLAMYLDNTTKRQGSANMPSIFQSINPSALVGRLQPPRPSDELEQIISDREHEIQNGNAGNAAVPAPIDDENDETDDDDGFEFSVH